MAELQANTPPSHDQLFSTVKGVDYKSVEENAPEADASGVENQLTENDLAPTQAPKAATPPADSAPAPKADEDISDEEFLKLYEKRTGKKVKSLDDLKDPAPAPTAEEIAASLEREKDEALQWALGSEKIKKDIYDKAIIDKSKSPREIALKIFTEEQIADDPALSVEECEEMFSDFFNETEPEGSWKREKGEKAIAKMANEYLSQYKDIDTLQDQYKEYKTVAGAQKAHSKMISAVAKEMPEKMDFNYEYIGVDGQKENLTYSVSVDEKIIPQLVKEFTRPEMVGYFGQENTEAIKSEFEYHVFSRMKEKVIPALLKQHEERVLNDTYAKLKNIRNPQQPIAQPASGGQLKELPSHDALFTKSGTR